MKIIIIEGKQYWENQTYVSDNNIKFKIKLLR